VLVGGLAYELGHAENKPTNTIDYVASPSNALAPGASILLNATKSHAVFG
jgi:hypothetical protein